MKLLLFAGTADGRALAESLATLPIELHVSVATAYGADTLPAAVIPSVGRLDHDAIRDRLQREGFALAIDATHPYAAAASDNIRRAAAETGIPCLRLSRPSSDLAGCRIAADAPAAAALASSLPGNILLATGSKDLAAFTAISDYRERVYPRILPDAATIGECLRLGFHRSRIIAMQGPFSLDLNRALLRQFRIGVMITKDGGSEGGFPEKLQAAKEENTELVVIARPPEEGGLSAEQIVDHVGKMKP